MKTQKELIEQQRAELDTEWNKKYHNGQFVIQRRFGKCGMDKSGFVSIYGLHWNRRRRNSCSSYYGVSCNMSVPHTDGYFIDSDIVDNKERFFNNRPITLHKTQNSSWGRCILSDNMVNCLEKAEKLNFPKKLIDRFKKEYSDRIKLGDSYYNRFNGEYKYSVVVDEVTEAE